MRSKSLLFVVGIAVLLVTSVVSSQVLKPRVLLEREALKVVVADTFPKDLSCEVYLGSFDAGINVLGSKQLAIFEAEGKNGRIEKAEIHIGAASSISVIRNDPDKDSYMLFLFTKDEDGKILALFDLNLDGEWDVKKTFTIKKQQHFIRMENNWFEVDKIEGLPSNRPTATRGRTQYMFRKQWKSLPKSPSR